MKVYNLFAKHNKNIGDQMSVPSLYFDFGAEVEDIGYVTEPGSVIVYGGGGLFDPSMKGPMDLNVSDPSKKLILWGVGTNTHDVESDPYPDWIKRCSLVGLRDYGGPHRWVPCVSCMNPLLKMEADPFREVVVYAHHDVHNIPQIDAPMMTNWNVDFSDVVSFLSSAEYVVTNTYHGAYWATLLGRKVILYPFSTRHRFTKYSYPMLRSDQQWEAGIGSARVYENALRECRVQNILFYDKVLDCLYKLRREHHAAR